MKNFVRIRAAYVAALLAASTGVAACGDDAGGNDPRLCGNGVLDEGEACDDGNTEDGDGCSSTCTIEGGGEVEVCDDGVDNSGNGLSDCDDPACASDPACAENPGTCGDEIPCSDPRCATDPACETPPPVCGTDIPCSDPRCASDPACETPTPICGADLPCSDPACADDPACAPVEGEICDDGIDNDEDGRIDCRDPDCIDDPACEGEPDPEICDDGIDNDEDGLTDCDDPECDEDAACVVVPDDEICDDGIDNDGDGRIDCRDPDCVDDPACDGEPDPEICDDGIDNDEDGLTDCDDPECDDDPACAIAPDPEICDDEIDNDGDGFTDCDDPDCEDDPSCLGPVCGNGILEEGEACDDGIGNSDRIPDACRPDCTLPSCGDGVRDTGEACDLGDDNGDGAACTETCEINNAVACADFDELIDLNEVGTVTGSTLRFASSFLGATDAQSPPAACAEATDGRDRLFLYTAPADGNFVLTTEVAGTSGPHFLYLLESCLNPVPTECAASAASQQGTRLVLEGARAGDEFLVVVDELGGTTGTSAFILEARPFTGISPVGGNCAPSSGLVCPGTAECIRRGNSFTCEENEAPVISGINVTLLDFDGFARIVVSGTDANADPFDLVIAQVRTETGGVVNGPFRFTNQVVPSVTGTNFTFTVNADFTGIGGSTGRPVAVDMQVLDARGNLSAIATGTYPAYPTDVAGPGEACGPGAAVCDTGLFCSSTTGPGTCAPGVAPTLASVTPRWINETTVEFTYRGVDPNRDVVGAILLSELPDEDLGPNFFLFNDVTYDGNNYTAVLTVPDYPGTAAGATSTWITLAFDSGELAGRPGSRSNVLVGAYPAKPPGAAIGGSCVVDQLASRCQTGLVCTPQGETASCQVPFAPTLSRVIARPSGIEGANALVTFAGGDRNADVEIIFVAYYDAEGDLIDFDAFSGRRVQPAIWGRTSFELTLNFDAPGGTQFIGVVLEDGTELESRLVIDRFAAGSGAGAACTLDDFNCDGAEGLVCGASDTCETNQAPTLDAFSITRPNGNTLALRFAGGDANGDVLLARIEYFVADGRSIGSDIIGLGADSIGAVSFDISRNLTGVSGVPITRIRAFLEDSGGLESGRLDADVPPERQLGQACSGDPAVDACLPGLDCIEGLCVGDPPSIDTLLADYDENVRNLTVLAEGSTEGTLLTTFSFAFFASTVVDFEPLTLDVPVATLTGAGLLTIAEGGTWELEIDFDATLLDFLDIDQVQLTVTAAGGLTSGTAEASFARLAGPFDPCEDGTDVCYAGFTCTADDDGDFCDFNPDDFCAGVFTLDLGDVADFDEDDESLVYSFNLADFDNLSVETCDGGASAGPEVAFLLVLPFDAVVEATTANPGTNADTYLYVRDLLCASPEFTIACNDDDAGTLASTVVFEADANTPYFLYVDSFSAAANMPVELRVRFFAP